MHCVIPSEYVEILVGVYARQLSSMLWEIQYLLSRLESKREFVALALASYRNRMVRCAKGKIVRTFLVHKNSSRSLLLQMFKRAV